MTASSTSSASTSALVNELHLPPATLVGYWALDGDGTDLSGNGVHGRMINAEWVTGLRNDALFLDGDDAFVITDSGRTPLDVTNVLMMAWVMPSQYDVAADRGIVMNKESAYEFGLEDASGLLQGAFGPGCWRWWGTVNIPLDVWTHVAVGNDATDQKHFVNGDLIESDHCPGDLTVNDEDFKIGARGGNGEHRSQFRGSVDEAMLFSSCLSQFYIDKLFYATYNAPPAQAHINLAQMPAGLVGYWPMDLTAEDVSGNSLQGELVLAEFVTGHW
eukprot:SAG31_NODE_812_length_11915_cov_64.697360_16_plen_273_part_01